MTRVLSRVRQVIALRSQSSAGVVYECRHCGETVDGDTTECPACGRAAISRYELSESG
jgi:rubrerythrin